MSFTTFLQIVSQHVLEKSDSTNYIAVEIHTTLSTPIIKYNKIWTTGNVGIKINETADTLAKWATDVGAKFYPPLTPEEDIKQIEVKLKSEWDSRFIAASEIKGKIFASFFPIIPNKPWYNNITLSPKEIKTINRRNNNEMIILIIMK